MTERRRHTDQPIRVQNGEDPIRLLDLMSKAYDAGELGRFESVYLDRLNCYYDVLPKKTNGDVYPHIFGKAEGKSTREVFGKHELARRHNIDGMDEVLACIATQDTSREGGRAGRKNVHFYGLRQTQQGWRVFAIGGPAATGKSAPEPSQVDSRCTGWLSNQFADADWTVAQPANGKLSSFGDTPCGTIPLP